MFACSHISIWKKNGFLQPITQLFHRSDLVPARPQTLVPFLIKETYEPSNGYPILASSHAYMYVHMCIYIYVMHVIIYMALGYILST